MNQYIITEKMLQRGHEYMSKTGRKKYEKEIRSNPYNPQAEREKVLTKIQKLIRMWDRGIPDDDEVLQELGLIEAELQREGKEEQG